MDIKFITYNIDGLPDRLNLKDLPFIFKPFAWIYRLISGTYKVSINDNVDNAGHISHISKCLKESNVDVVGVQEDFNYHDELMSNLTDYGCGTYSGGFNISKLFSSVEGWSRFPLPRFKADGLNLLVKNSRVTIKNEDIVKWKKSSGYFKHANDALTHKGFRFYTVNVDGVDIDVYVLHMDADFYSGNYKEISKDVKTRGILLKQLTDYILKRHAKGYNNPVVIFGDTNSTNKYQWDIENICNYLLDPINNTQGLFIQEAVPSNGTDVDRLFFINDNKSEYDVTVKECFYDNSFNDEIGRVSDHNPLITTLTITHRE